MNRRAGVTNRSQQRISFSPLGDVPRIPANRSGALPMKIRLGNAEIGLRRYLALWTAVVVVFAVQGYVHDAMLAGATWSMLDYLRWSMILWYTWAALAPLVFRLAARYPLLGPLQLRNLGIQPLASMGVTLLAMFIGAAVSTLFEPSSLAEQLRQY